MLYREKSINFWPVYVYCNSPTYMHYAGVWQLPRGEVRDGGEAELPGRARAELQPAVSGHLLVQGVRRRLDKQDQLCQPSCHRFDPCPLEFDAKISFSLLSRNSRQSCDIHKRCEKS